MRNRELIDYTAYTGRFPTMIGNGVSHVRFLSLRFTERRYLITLDIEFVESTTQRY